MMIGSSLAGPALAGERSNPLSPIPAEVHAGEKLALTWEGLPADVEELEILLSLDDGRSFRVRVSPELEAHEQRFVWRVPNLASGSARLRVRASLDGEETEFEPTERFAIRARTDAPAELDLVHEGEWWPGLDARPGSVTAPTLGDSRPVFTEREAESGVAVPSRVAVDAPERTLGLYSTSACPRAERLFQPARNTKPSFVPARK